MKSIGINLGHNASVALAMNNEIRFAISEERIVRDKNYFGIPTEALNYVYSNYCTKEEIDCFGIFHNSNHDFQTISRGADVRKFNSYEQLRKKIIDRFGSNQVIGKGFNWYERLRYDEEKMKIY